VSYVEKSVEEYLGERCSDLLDKYVKSYMSYLENNPDNLKLYSDAVRYKNNPAVANVLRDLVIAVNAANEQ
jgi:hypothetical protein